MGTADALACSATADAVVASGLAGPHAMAVPSPAPSPLPGAQAWVAVGGDRPEDPDEEPSGVVDTDILTRIIKNDFGLTINIARLIEEVDLDGSGEVDFHEFRAMLS